MKHTISIRQTMSNVLGTAAASTSAGGTSAGGTSAGGGSGGGGYIVPSPQATAMVDRSKG